MQLECLLKQICLPDEKGLGLYSASRVRRNTSTCLHAVGSFYLLRVEAAKSHREKRLATLIVAHPAKTVPRAEYNPTVFDYRPVENIFEFIH
eukprot:1451603-Amphidinium_carterae.2